MNMDPEFNCLGKLIIGTELNTTAARERVTEIERKIQVVNERMCTVHGGLTYERMNIQMIIELGKYEVMRINTFPPKSNISRAYSPRTIITGYKLESKKQQQRPLAPMYRPTMIGTPPTR